MRDKDTEHIRANSTMAKRPKPLFTHSAARSPGNKFVNKYTANAERERDKARMKEIADIYAT